MIWATAISTVIASVITALGLKPGLLYIWGHARYPVAAVFGWIKIYKYSGESDCNLFVAADSAYVICPLQALIHWPYPICKDESVCFQWMFVVFNEIWWQFCMSWFVWLIISQILFFFKIHIKYFRFAISCHISHTLRMPWHCWERNNLKEVNLSKISVKLISKMLCLFDPMELRQRDLYVIHALNNKRRGMIFASMKTKLIWSR